MFIPLLNTVEMYTQELKWFFRCNHCISKPQNCRDIRWISLSEKIFFSKLTLRAFDWHRCTNALNKPSQHDLKFSIPFDATAIDVTSANKINLHPFICSGKSLMKSMKNNGPCTDPWGTPTFILNRLKQELPTLTTLLLSVRKLYNQSEKIPLNPILYNLSIKNEKDNRTRVISVA